MGREINLMWAYPPATRKMSERDDRVTEENIKIAGQFGREFFDGDRQTGYGGYYYHARFFQRVVQVFRDYYHLPDTALILDVGCAKGFMMFDFKQLMPDIQIYGIDVSQYALDNAKPEMRPYMRLASAVDIPFPNDSFDLVISLASIHNLEPELCKQALREIERVSRRHSFITIDAWRNDKERKRLLQWVLTGKTYMHVDDWKKLFVEVGYTGDYYWFIA